MLSVIMGRIQFDMQTVCRTKPADFMIIKGISIEYVFILYQRQVSLLVTEHQ